MREKKNRKKDYTTENVTTIKEVALLWLTWKFESYLLKAHQSIKKLENHIRNKKLYRAGI